MNVNISLLCFGQLKYGFHHCYIYIYIHIASINYKFLLRIFSVCVNLGHYCSCPQKLEQLK